MFLLCPPKHDSEVCHLYLKLSSTGPKLDFADIRILPSIPGQVILQNTYFVVGVAGFAVVGIIVVVRVVVRC